MSNPEQVSPLISQQVANLHGGASEYFLTATQVRARYGNCSDMWLWRRLRDGSGFPPPVLIAARRFWRLTSLIEWERERAVPAPQGPHSAAEAIGLDGNAKRRGSPRKQPGSKLPVNAPPAG